MYKIVGKFFDEDIERECKTPDYAIGVFMAYVQKGCDTLTIIQHRMPLMKLLM